MLQAATGEAGARELMYAHMKSEQLRVVKAFIQGRDVFAILRTGYGKNLCYGCFHLCLNCSGCDGNYSNYGYVITSLQ